MKEIKPYKYKMPFYCKKCGKCKNAKEADNNLKIKNNTGYTHDIYCIKREQVVYGL